MRPTPSIPAELIAAALPSSEGLATAATLDAVVERLHDDVVLPERATDGSAGHDLRAYLEQRTVRCSDGRSQHERAADERAGEWGITLAPDEMALVPLGFRTRLPRGIEAQINDAPVERRIVHGERIAQVVFARYAELELREGLVQRSTERAGGFGSTGQA